MALLATPGGWPGSEMRGWPAEAAVTPDVPAPDETQQWHRLPRGLVTRIATPAAATERL